MKLLPIILRFLFQYPDAAILQDCWHVEGVATTLDLGCAGGRVLAQGLAAGRNVSGIDDNGDIIFSAQEYLISEIDRLGVGSQLRFELHVGDFSTLDLTALKNAPFQTIICAANTWSMVLDPEARLATLRSCKKALAPDGQMLIWIKNDNPSTDFERTMQADTPHGRAEVLLKWQEDPVQRLRTFTMNLKLDDQTETHVFKTALLSCSQMLSEFDQAGFKVDRSYGDLNKGPLDPASSPFQVYFLKAKP